MCKGFPIKSFTSFQLERVIFMEEIEKTKKKHKKNKIKLLINLAINLLGTITIVTFLLFMQTEAACKKQNQDSITKLDEVVEIMVKNASEKEEVIRTYDQSYLDKAQTIAYLIQTDKAVSDALKDEEKGVENAKQLIEKLAKKENFDLESINLFDILGNRQVSFISGHEGESLELDRDSVLPFILENQTIKSVFTPFNYNHSGKNQSEYIVSSPSDLEIKENEIIRYYGCKITDTFLLLIGQDPSSLYEEVNQMISLNYLLSSVTVGSNGYVFAIDNNNDFAYYPDASLLGKDAYSYGLNNKNTKDGYEGWIKINKTSLYCVSMHLTKERIEEKFKELYEETFASYVKKGLISKEEAESKKTSIINQVNEDFSGLEIYIAGVSEKEIKNNRTVTCSIGAILFILVSGLQISYCYIVKNEIVKKHKQKSKRLFKHLYINGTVSRKVTPLTMVGLIIIFLATLYTQSIFALSKQIKANGNYLKEIEQTLNLNEEQAKKVNQECENEYIKKCDAINYVVKTNPGINVLFLDDEGNHRLIHRDSITDEQRNMAKSYLKTLAQKMGIIDIYLINTDGETLAASSVYQDFNLSKDPEAQSYPFWNVLKGYVPYYIQDSTTDDQGNSSQYVGQPIYKTYIGQDGKTYNDVIGMVQIAIDSQKYVSRLSYCDIAHVLDNIIVGTSGFSFAVDRTLETFVYYPSVSTTYTLIGQS